MRSFLINKNPFYWLRKGIVKKRTLWVARQIEKAIPTFGREAVVIKTVWKTEQLSS